MQRGAFQIIDLEWINLQITDAACPLGEKDSTFEVLEFARAQSS